MPARLMSAMFLLMICISHPLRQLRCRLRIKLSEASVYRSLLHIMWVVTFGTYPPSLLAAGCPHPYPLTVDPVSPVTVDLAVTLSAELLWLVKADFIITVVDQFISVCPAMAI